MEVERIPHCSYPSSPIEKRNCLSVVTLALLGYPWATCPAEIEGPVGTLDLVGILRWPRVEVLCSVETLVAVCFLDVAASVDLHLVLDSAVEIFHSDVDS